MFYCCCPSADDFAIVATVVAVVDVAPSLFVVVAFVARVCVRACVCVRVRAKDPR